ncbi:MAG: polysaccharide deacetylase family protein [Bacteroidota bacterium]|nr:polysaccharide deacetylase family protein [Bacteroidota bacterium]
MFPQLIWQKRVTEKILYITFDDGPCPGVTDFVLEQLEQYHAKATFFCVGSNVIKHPELYQTLLQKGHVTGNHTQEHLNGLFCKSTTYYDDIERASKSIDSKLFRPPYGKIKTSQINYLKKRYQIIMWDFLTADFDADLDIELCKKKMGKYIKPGSIIVFHDSIKAAENLKILLPYMLHKYAAEDYQFHSL